MGLLGTSSALQAPPDLTNLGEFSRDFLLRLSIFSINSVGEFAGNASGVAIQDRDVTGTDLTEVVEDDNLSVERSGLLSRVVLGVRGNISTVNILDRNVLDVETDVVTRLTGPKLFVMHLN